MMMKPLMMMTRPNVTTANMNQDYFTASAFKTGLKPSWYTGCIRRHNCVSIHGPRRVGSAAADVVGPPSVRVVSQCAAGLSGHSSKSSMSLAGV